LDVHVSVDPTQIGYSLDAGMGRENAERIGAALAAQPARPRNALMLDMEDFAMVETTIALHDALVEADVPTAITLQAYLRRTEDDLARLAGSGATVRLVKGAFAESAARAFTGRRRITENYLRLAEIMLSAEARSAGFTPVFGTHDDAVIRHVAALALENGWPDGSFEFEMLYGVRPALLKSLAEAGHAVRVYLPFGRDWWPYAARRVGENLANARFVARALLGR
jgi:proline dehydrogenase